jgi:hypothetical protein
VNASPIRTHTRNTSFLGQVGVALIALPLPMAGVETVVSRNHTRVMPQTNGGEVLESTAGVVADSPGESA